MCMLIEHVVGEGYSQMLTLKHISISFMRFPFSRLKSCRIQIIRSIIILSGYGEILLSAEKLMTPAV